MKGEAADVVNRGGRGSKERGRKEREVWFHKERRRKLLVRSVLLMDEGYTNIAQNVGVCWRHGAKKEIYLCSNDGCTILLSKEECARGMGQRSNDASAKDAQIMLNKERCAQRMGQSANFVTVMDGQIKLSEVGGLCVRHGAKRKRCSSEG